MKFGLNLLLWTTDVTDAHAPLLEQIKSWGYDGVEIPVFDLSVARYQALGKRLDGLGLERTSVAISTGDANPIAPEASLRQAAVTRLKQVIDCCQAMGVKNLCGPMHSALGQFSGRGATADEWKWGLETLRQVGDYARQAGVTIVLEYLNRFECYFLNSAADAVRFVNDLNHPHVRTMYDTFHANIEEKSIAQAIRTCAPVMAHVHISENDRSTPGEGNVDWDTTFSTLKEVKYDGWMVVEAFGLALPDLAAATKIWRKMFTTEEALSQAALKFMKTRTAK